MRQGKTAFIHRHKEFQFPRKAKAINKTCIANNSAKQLSFINNVILSKF